jgi:hypothetical protein
LLISSTLGNLFAFYCCCLVLQVDSYLTHILRVLSGLPDVTEVEINPEALWRPKAAAAKSGSGPFMSVLEQAKDIRAAAAAAAASLASGGGGGAAGDASDEEDEDE